MVHQVDIAIGTRVRFRDHSIGVRLRSFTGTITRPDEWDGYVVVRLDEPDSYINADGTAEDIYEVAEARENLTPT